MLTHPQFDPIAISIGPVALHWYGLMYFIGFLSFIYFGKKQLRIQTWSLICLLYTSPSPRDAHESRMPSSA